MKIGWKSCIRLGVTVFVTFLAIHYWSSLTGFVGLMFGAASSLILGCIIAYVLNILMSFYEKHYFPKSQSRGVVKSRRVVCLLAAMLTLVAVIALVVGLVLPELAACVRLLVAEIPLAIDEAVEWLEETGVLSTIMTEETAASLTAIDWQAKMTELISVLAAGVGGVAQVAVGAVSATISVVAQFIIGLIFAIYLLVGKETLGGQVNRLMDHYLKPAWNEKIRYVVGIFHNSFHKFIVGQCIEAVVLGVLCIIGMSIIRLPYAMMIGTLIGFTALIPVAGAYIGAAVGAFMILTVSPIQALIFLIFVVILQQLEGNLIYPKVVGSSIGLPGVWVLAAVTIGGGIMGIPGMLLGVPTVASVYQLIKNDLNKKS
ncbi:MAG: AI-2E family transporter [Lachnospiraceae bacterium]|nr:AI-2E family transporter [Lachnospiraceae bacterium]